VKVEASSEALDATLRDFAGGQKVFGRYTLQVRRQVHGCVLFKKLPNV